MYTDQFQFFGSPVAFGAVLVALGFLLLGDFVNQPLARILRVSMRDNRLHYPRFRYLVGRIVLGKHSDLEVMVSLIHNIDLMASRESFHVGLSLRKD